jgi:hypothetical protein
MPLWVSKNATGRRDTIAQDGQVTFPNAGTSQSAVTADGGVQAGGGVAVEKDGQGQRSATHRCITSATPGRRDRRRRGGRRNFCYPTKTDPERSLRQALAWLPHRRRTGCVGSTAALSSSPQSSTLLPGARAQRYSSGFVDAAVTTLTSVVAHCASRRATPASPAAAASAYADPGVGRIGRRFCV